MFAHNTLWRGFKSRQHEVVFVVILVPQNNIIMCKHNIIETSRVFKLNVYFHTSYGNISDIFSTR